MQALSQLSYTPTGFVNLLLACHCPVQISKPQIIGHISAILESLQNSLPLIQLQHRIQ